MYTIEDAIEDMRTEFCFNCREYKGMVETEDGDTYCIFCE